ncbi:DUF1629 domain-containing protein [Bradyrhizobium xenonodulans]|uniref:DUF1629 domain-containing protein n=1 Tax=Bradyrhizobium xenonodulans TaxID=2736875 RepID=A0ABY7ME13_9BRAD|nr:DUF1629 domain-containing protein [Bradyrhizobium xenonodulans]WBL76564.1 DUF1629 domain-containing protein [Bradyrhizobium xenonodulans]
MAASGNERRKKKAPKLYRVGLDFRIHKPPGWEMENLVALGAGRVPLHSPRGKRSFPPLAETPRLLIDKSLGRPPVDWELFHDFWLVSDRMKNVLEAVDRDGVAFLRCETRSLSGGAPVYWLCDIVRQLDVIDEEKSNVVILDDGTDFRRYDNMATSSFVFREEAIGSAHIFRARFLNRVVCDQAMKDACKAAGLRGLRFGNPYVNWG